MVQNLNQLYNYFLYYTSGEFLHSPEPPFNKDREKQCVVLSFYWIN